MVGGDKPKLWLSICDYPPHPAQLQKKKDEREVRTQDDSKNSQQRLFRWRPTKTTLPTSLWRSLPSGLALKDVIGQLNHGTSILQCHSLQITINVIVNWTRQFPWAHWSTSSDRISYNYYIQRLKNGIRWCSHKVEQAQRLITRCTLSIATHMINVWNRLQYPCCTGQLG